MDDGKGGGDVGPAPVLFDQGRHFLFHLLSVLPRLLCDDGKYSTHIMTVELKVSLILFHVDPVDRSVIDEGDAIGHLEAKPRPPGSSGEVGEVMAARIVRPESEEVAV